MVWKLEGQCLRVGPWRSVLGPDGEREVGSEQKLRAGMQRGAPPRPPGQGLGAPGGGKEFSGRGPPASAHRITEGAPAMQKLWNPARVWRVWAEVKSSCPSVQPVGGGTQGMQGASALQDPLGPPLTRP